MTNETTARIKQHTQDLNNIYKQRKLWLYTSIFVIICGIGLIVEWDTLGIDDKKIWWSVLILSSSITVSWWWWTMRSLIILVRSIHNEYDILNEITVDIEEMRHLIKENINYENTRNHTTRRKSSK